MNQIQKLSQKILCDRLKLQMGLALDTDLDFRILQAMSGQLKNERMAELARAEATFVSMGSGQPA